ncbi:hypothetical protein [Streptomyces sp. NPDC098101]|uniref:hypothetical protein n=1 Tax=Streptomyces sp. NPDC098101 TaxID=3366096 RepID=UPI00381519A2
MTTIPPRRRATDTTAVATTVASVSVSAGPPVRTRPPVETPEGDTASSTATDARTTPAAPPAEAAGAPVLPTQGVRTGALPPLPPLDLHGAVPVLDAVTAEPPAPLPELAVLRALVRDAARRATALLQGHVPEAHDTVADIVRFTVGAGGEHLETAAAHLGLTPLRMRHLTAAYHHGGPHGAAACLSPRPAHPAALAGAEAAIRPLRPSPGAPLERHRDRLTDPSAGVQLRHGPDGRWYPYADLHGTWQPVAGPHGDPARAYRAARLALRQRR